MSSGAYRKNPRCTHVHLIVIILAIPARMQVRGGILADECAEVMQDFFRKRRAMPRI